MGGEDTRDSNIRLSIVAGPTDGARAIQTWLNTIRKNAIRTQKALQLGITGGGKGAGGGTAGPSTASTASMESLIKKRIRDTKRLLTTEQRDLIANKRIAVRELEAASKAAGMRGDKERSREAASKANALRSEITKILDANEGTRKAIEKGGKAEENVVKTNIARRYKLGKQESDAIAGTGEHGLKLRRQYQAQMIRLDQDERKQQTGRIQRLTGLSEKAQSAKAGYYSSLARTAGGFDRSKVKLPGPGLRPPPVAKGPPGGIFRRGAGFTSAPEFVAIGAAAIAFKKTAGAAMDFEKAMATVGAVTGATGTQFEKLRKAALDAASGTVFTAQQVGDAMVTLGRAGFSTNETIAAAEPILKLATVAGEDFSQTAQSVTDVLRMFNISATQTSHVTDILAQASISSKAEIRDLGLALSYVGTTAAQFGLSLEETVGALSAMADAGIRGSMAGTGLRRILTDLIDPKHADELHNLGLTFADVDVKTVGLAGALRNLQKASITNQEAFEFFQVRGLTPFLTLIKDGKKPLEEYISTLRDVEGVVDSLEKKITSNLSDSLLKLKSAALNPVIESFERLDRVGAKAAQSLTSAFESKGTGGTILGDLATAGVVATGVFGTAGTLIVGMKGIALVTQALGAQYLALNAKVLMLPGSFSAAALGAKAFGIAARAVPWIALAGAVEALATKLARMDEAYKQVSDRLSNPALVARAETVFGNLQIEFAASGKSAEEFSDTLNSRIISANLSLDSHRDKLKDLQAEISELAESKAQAEKMLLGGGAGAAQWANKFSQAANTLKAKEAEALRETLAITEGEADIKGARRLREQLRKTPELAPDRGMSENQKAEMIKQEEAARKLESIWSSTASSIEGSFSDAFEKMALDGKKFADAMRDISKDIQRALVRNVAQQATANITAPIFGGASPGFSPAPGVPGMGTSWTLGSMFNSASPRPTYGNGLIGPPERPPAMAPTGKGTVPAGYGKPAGVTLETPAGKPNPTVSMSLDEINGQPVKTTGKSQSSYGTGSSRIDNMSLGQIMGVGVGGMMAFQGLSDIMKGKSGGMAQAVTGGATMGGSIAGAPGAAIGAVAAGVAGGYAKLYRKQGSAFGVAAPALRSIGIGGGASLNRKRRRRAKQAAAEMAFVEAQRQQERERAATQLQETFGGGLATTEGAAVLGQMLSGGINEAELQALEAGAGDVVGALGGAVGAVQAPQTTVTMNPTFIIRTGLDIQKAAQALGQMIAQSSPYGSIGSP